MTQQNRIPPKEIISELHAEYMATHNFQEFLQMKSIQQLLNDTKIVDEIRKIVKKESDWLDKLDDKFNPYFDYREIIKKLQQLLEGEKK